ncbi:hypothetical protein TNCV_3414481 [Trichonephila clavipes]|uniref:Uncharacterized protein n=1 Tax=Trichonephila clavipes TaxID=2585209 RepID=A0A8X6RM68_TRICX|nr:hypothetical protein TNCV_3414481 [Trichonephila clavipes]
MSSTSVNRRTKLQSSSPAALVLPKSAKIKFVSVILKLLRLDIFELRETKLPVRWINTTNEWRLVQGHETTPLRVKGDIEYVSRELNNGG